MNTPENQIELTNWDCLQILACSQALQMASKHKMYLTRPENIRATASHWLTRLNVPHSPKAKWATLDGLFNQAFGDVLNQMKKERESK